MLARARDIVEAHGHVQRERLARSPRGYGHAHDLGPLVAAERSKPHPHGLGNLAEGVDLGKEVGLHVVGDAHGTSCLEVRSQAGHVLLDGSRYDGSGR